MMDLVPLQKTGLMSLARDINPVPAVTGVYL